MLRLFVLDFRPQHKFMIKIKLTKEGADAFSTCKGQKSGHDAHIRIENGMIAVDVFDSSKTDPNKAHEASEMFSLSKKGIREAEAFLKEYGITVTW
jgi:hypothetical protein